MRQTFYENLKGQIKKIVARTQNHAIKPYKFDPEVKSQHNIGITNVLDTSSYGGRPMCPI